MELGYLHVSDLTLDIWAKSYQGVSASQMVFLLESPEYRSVRGERKVALDKLKYAGGPIVKKKGLNPYEVEKLNL